MKDINLKDLDQQIINLIKSKRREYNCLIVPEMDENKFYITVITCDCKLYEHQVVSEKHNTDCVCTGIMKWFRSHSNELK